MSTTPGAPIEATEPMKNCPRCHSDARFIPMSSRWGIVHGEMLEDFECVKPSCGYKWTVSFMAAGYGARS